MTRTDKAFWWTVIPAVLIWNSIRPWTLDWISGPVSSGPAAFDALSVSAAANLGFSGALAGIAGYVAAVVGSPRHLRAAGNAAIGLTIVFGLQNFIEHRGAGFPSSYFILLPVIVAGFALMGGLLRALQSRGSREP